MTKDEYVKTLEKYMADNDLEREDGLTYLDGIQDAATLARQLDEPEKVTIPQFVADWIEEYSKWCSRLGIVNQIISNKVVENDGWLDSGDNQELLLKAIANGYEVEKEPKYYVQIKGFDNYIDLKYVNYRIPDNTFGLDNQLESSTIKAAFTKSWLKDHWSEYEAYNNAGLLEFKEVEDES